jgi:hypothetical protein
MPTDSVNACPQVRPEQSLAQIIAFAKRDQAARIQKSTADEDNAYKRMERRSKKASELVQLIRDGAFTELEAWIRGYKDNSEELAEIANVARFRLNCSELSIPYTTISRGQPLANGKRTDMVHFMIRFQTVQRILVIPTHPDYHTTVFGPGRSGTGVATPLTEDPRLLLKQIGRIACINRYVSPPPLAMR